MGMPHSDSDAGSSGLDGVADSSVAAAPSVDGGASTSTVPLTTQRRSLGPMKRVESRVPVNEMQDQPLITQAKKLLEEQKRQ